MNSYTKLKSGAWGVRVQGTKPDAGSSVTVRTKAGAEKTETIIEVLWSGADKTSGETVSLCSIAQRARPSNGNGNGGGNSYGRRYECEDCGEYVTPGTSCWETELRH